MAMAACLSAVSGSAVAWWRRTSSTGFSMYSVSVHASHPLSFLEHERSVTRHTFSCPIKSHLFVATSVECKSQWVGQLESRGSTATQSAGSCPVESMVQQRRSQQGVVLWGV